MKIQVLPEHVANRIAAGEVVDRPVGVVRELVDNAIDADARNITVEIVRGGKELIRVSDDGTGMAKEDASLAFARHATSKLRSAEELSAIATLGFRGEALAAIASVARIRLRTRERISSLGFELNLSAGNIIEKKDCSAPLGTLMEVHDLFFNAPARQKFLKSDRSEELKVRGHLLQMALAHPEINFRYLADQREVFNLPARDSMLDRARALFRGSVIEFSERTKLGLEGAANGAAQIELDGLIGHPALASSKLDAFVIIVNGRVVTDRTVIRALRDGFDSTLKAREVPIGVLNIKMPCEMVDVNVHPQKSEVRFSHSQALFLAIRSAIRRSVNKFSTPVAAHEMSPALAQAQQSNLTNENYSAAGLTSKIGSSNTAQNSLFLTPVTNKQFYATAGISSRGDREQEILPDFKFSHLRYRGQIFECYLLCESSQKLIIVDMHAAHERYNYNLVRNRFKSAEKVSQPLLIPLEIDLNPIALDRCREHAEALTQLGFELEFKSEELLKINAVPSILSEARDIAGLFRELAEIELDGSEVVEQRIDSIAARIACHASIRSGKIMTNEEVEALFAALDASAFSAACPHGRPVVVEFALDEVERWFGRDR